jgi:hypothetical protein
MLGNNWDSKAGSGMPANWGRQQQHVYVANSKDIMNRRDNNTSWDENNSRNASNSRDLGKSHNRVSNNLNARKIRVGGNSGDICKSMESSNSISNNYTARNIRVGRNSGDICKSRESSNSKYANNSRGAGDSTTIEAARTQDNVGKPATPGIQAAVISCTWQ